MNDANGFSGRDAFLSTRVERALVVMDVPNIMRSAKRAAGLGDATRLKPRFSFENILEAIGRSHAPGYTEREIVAAHAVTLMRDDSDQQKKIQANLESAGFRVQSVVQKRPVAHADPFVHQGEEGTTDLELTNMVWDAVYRQRLLDQPINTVVLVSGDGDYRGMLARLRELGIRVEVYGPSGSTARSLQSIAHKSVLMTDSLPADVPENKRFIFFETREEDGYDFDSALEDADNPYYGGSVTGEIPAPSSTSGS